MPTVYRLELAKTARSGCTNKECKDNVIKIQKGELRFGTQVEIKEHVSWKFRHWGCVTPQVIANLKETIEDNLDYLDGYDEIDENSQAKVRKALEVGHVADDDWKGDVERNRPGMKGFRSPAKKKTAEEHKDGSPTPSKPKKRGRAKKEDEDQDAENPPAKKPKATQKLSKKNLAEEQDEDADLEANPVPEPIKKARGRTRKTDAKVKADDEYLKQENGEEDVAPAVAAKISRKTTSSKKFKQEDTESDLPDESTLQAPEHDSKAISKSKAVAVNGSNATSKGRKGKNKTEVTQDGDEDHDPKTKPQTNRVTRSQAS